MMRWMVVLVVGCAAVWADGGTVLFRKAAGDFDVTVFSKSEALRAGVNDLSVMVQRADHSTVMDANVLLHLTLKQPTGEILRLTSIANHKNATNKLLYAATVNIPATGSWKVEAEVTADKKTETAGGEIQVLAPLPPAENYWPYIAMVPAVGIAFLINRKLRERFRAKVR